MTNIINGQKLEDIQNEIIRLIPALDLITDHIIITDPDGHIVYANNAVKTQTGYSIEEIIGKNPGQIWGGNMPKEFYEKMWKTIKIDKIAFTGEIKNKRKDGLEYWAQLTIYPALDDKKNVKYFVGVEPNIDARKKAEEELRLEKEKVESFVECIGDAVVAIDRNWNIILWNKEAATISGWEKSEVMNKPFREIVKFIKEKDRSESIRFIEDAMLFAKITNMENNTLLIKKNNEEVIVEDSCAPIWGSEKKIVGAIIIFRDITKKKEQEYLRSDFAYASHQLRTPVNKAMWSLESIEDEEDISKIKKATKDAYLALESAVKLNNSIIEVSEIDQEIIVPKFEETNVVGIINKIISDNQSRIEELDIKISFYPSKDSFIIKSDKKIISRTIYEVLDNAIIYNKKGGNIGVALEDTENGLLISIINTGVGIIEESTALIFKKFFRGNNFDTSKIPGCGLGLYIAERYAKLLRGKIWFKSEVNKTTIFYLLIPNNK